LHCRLSAMVCSKGPGYGSPQVCYPTASAPPDTPSLRATGALDQNRPNWCCSGALYQDHHLDVRSNSTLNRHLPPANCSVLKHDETVQEAMLAPAEKVVYIPCLPIDDTNPGELPTCVCRVRTRLLKAPVSFGETCPTGHRPVLTNSRSSKS
jgi:hypothetical protein